MLISPVCLIQSLEMWIPDHIEMKDTHLNGIHQVISMILNIHMD